MSHAEKIVTERNNIQKIPQSMSESDSLSIICARSAFVLQCFFDYKNCFPNLNRTHDKFLEAGLRENLKNVVAQNCRLGILQRSIPVTALMSKSHPLANSSRVSLKDLTGYPFIADAHIDPDDTLDVLGLQSHTDLLYICDRGTIFDAVRKGNYIAIGISIPEEDARRMNCVCCPIADGAPMAVALLHSRTFTLRPREKHFIRYLTDRLHKRYSG